MKLRDIAKGTRAIRRVKLPLVNVRCDLLPDLPELAAQRERDRAAIAADGNAPAAPDYVEVGLRVLTGDETVEVLQKAAEYARSRGSTDPKPGDPLYEFGLLACRVLVAAVDPDSDPSKPEPFFASLDELLGSEHIGRDGIALLAEQHETWQDLCSPSALKLPANELFSQIERMAAAETPDFFESLRPGTRWILARTMAALLVSLLEARSQSGSTGITSGTDSRPSSASETGSSGSGEP